MSFSVRSVFPRFGFAAEFLGGERGRQVVRRNRRAFPNAMPRMFVERRTLLRRHRAVVWGMLAVHGLVVSGLPLPMAGGLDAVAEKRLSGKDRSTPFPCMDKPCGCATAEQCFTSCCCHTPAETLAWAKANRLEPSLLAALERRVTRTASTAIGQDSRPSGCCGGGAKPRATPSCCSRTDAEADMCTDYRSLAANTDRPAEPEAPDRTGGDDASRCTPRGRAVSMKAMLACGGITAAWSSLAAAVPPLRVEIELAAAPVGEIVIGDDVAGSGLAVPDAPPPRA
jgi:hypothetical protein